jgi:hypothetical protein
MPMVNLPALLAVEHGCGVAPAMRLKGVTPFWRGRWDRIGVTERLARGSWADAVGVHGAACSGCGVGAIGCPPSRAGSLLPPVD